jgi:CheY-like chemotaxis protein
MPSDTVDILLVEDSDDDAAFFTDALEETKINVQWRRVSNGAEALTLLFGSSPGDGLPIVRPRLIVLDLKLPKVSGLELLRQLKSNAHARTIPVVVLSSSQEKRDLAESYKLGVNSYLVKPMDPERFDESVRILCRYWLQFNEPPKD